MAVVLPGGDYERALRMAGASNFMEALEAGIDRGIRRQAELERAARARDLYNRQVASQQAALMGDLIEIGSAGFTAGQPTTGAPSAAPTTGQAVAVSPTTGQVIAAEGASVSDAPRAAAPSPTAAALAEAVSPASSPAVAEDPQGPLFGPELPPGFGQPMLGPELPPATSGISDARRAQLERLDAAPPVVLPSEGPVADAARKQRQSMFKPAVQAPLDTQTKAREDALRAEELVIKGAPGASQQLSEALSALAQTDPNVLAARQALAEAVKAKEDFESGLRSRGQTHTGIINTVQAAKYRARIAEAQRNLDEALASARSAGSVPVPATVTGEFSFPVGSSGDYFTARELGYFGDEGLTPEEVLDDARNYREKGDLRAAEALERHAEKLVRNPELARAQGLDTADRSFYPSAPPAERSFTAFPLRGDVKEASADRYLSEAKSPFVEDYSDEELPKLIQALQTKVMGDIGRLDEEFATGNYQRFNDIPTTQDEDARYSLLLDAKRAARERGLPAIDFLEKEFERFQGERAKKRGSAAGASGASAAPAGGGDGSASLPTGGPGAFATQAAGVTAALSDDPVLAAARALQAGLPQEVARAQEQRRLQGIEENALGAGSMAPGDLGFGATPGTPLEQAVSKQAAVAEEVELAGPEPEAVKADQTVDVAGKVYTVKKGDTLGRVSSSFGAPLASVVAANQDVLAPGGKPRQIKRGEKVLLEGQDLIYPGDRIRIPTGEGRETGGEAGPVDPRPVTTVTGPGGQVTSSEGVLARVQRANKTNAQVKAALEREQRKTPDLPLNPFQKFGRAIDYTPTLQAVAFATLRAQQGDFTMLNQLAGRQVRNSEIPGLFAEYSEFVRGAKGRAKEVYLQQELLKETQANEAKRRALTGVKAMALTQFRRAGYSDEDAQIFAGHYADLYTADPQQARSWSTSLNSMGSDRAKAEAARLKRSGFGRGGFSSKDVNKAYNIVDKAQGRLTSAIKALSGVLAPGGYPLPLEEMKKAATENPALIASMQNYERALKTYNNAEKRLNQMLNEGLPEDPSVSLDKLLEQYGDSKVMKREVAKARRGEISWDGFEAELSRVVGAKSAEALAEHYKTTEAKDEPEAEGAPEAEVAAPPAAARTVAEIERELADVKAKPPASRREEQTQRSRAARLRQELSRETRAASARKIREDLIAKSNRVTGDAEDMLIRVNAGEAVPSSDRQSAVSSLKSLLSDLEKFESQGAEEGGSVGRVGIIALRRGVPVSEDIEDVKFLIKRLSR